MKKRIQETSSSMAEDILNLMEEKWKVNDGDMKYKQIKKTFRNKCNEAKDEWINLQYQEKENNTIGYTKFMYQKIKVVAT